MPFTASLGRDRAGHDLECSAFLKKGSWESSPWEMRGRYCRSCPHRFHKRPSCSVDFMSISDTDPLTIDLGNALMYAADDPDWEEFAGGIYEADFAYSKMNQRLPRPKKVLESFIESCVDREVNQEFWKRWNYTAVEGFEGKPAMKTTWVSPEVKQAVDRIIKNIVEPERLSGRRLCLFYAAMTILNEMSSMFDCTALDSVTTALMDACRSALTVGCSLEIS